MSATMSFLFSSISFLADRLWPQTQVAVAAEPEPMAKPEPVSVLDSESMSASDSESAHESESALPYIPSGHDHSARAGHPRRNMNTLVRLAHAGILNREEACWVELPGHPGARVDYTLRLLGDPYRFAFYAGKPECNGDLVGCHPDHIVRAIYSDQKRMAGWCAIRLADHGDMPLCQFHDLHVETM